MTRASPDPEARRPVLYQICRAGDRFEVGDGPFDLARLKMLVLGRGQEGGYDARAEEDLIRVADPWMSGRHAGIRRDGARHTLVDMGSTNGVLLNSRRVHEEPLESGDLIETGRTFWVYLSLATHETPPIEPTHFGEMRSWSPALCATLAGLGRTAKTPTPILITGEQGVGKEYCAKAIHQVSGRGGRLVTVDFGRVPPARQVAELLGTQDVRAGALYQASGGTLFLHRVELMTPEAQQVVLEALGSGRLLPPGGGRPVSVDLRAVSSTEADLDGLARRRLFAPALHELLAVTLAHIPPLRDRREDLGLLIDSLLERAGGAHAITRDACRAVLAYPWPRNVRELSKVLEGGAILAGDELAVDLRHLPGVVAGRSGIQQDAEPHITGESPRSQALQDPEVTSPGDDDGPVGLDEVDHEGPTGDPSPEHLAEDLEEFAFTDPDQGRPVQMHAASRGRPPAEPVLPPPPRRPPPPPPPPPPRAAPSRVIAPARPPAPPPPAPL
ncbi:MAG: sigma 54-interacting transcriptional regulator, partial [Deltaproteobacteria bacterium]|nr:sigma 54-interacting transcriptional regulator [Deltaproteobacteria bacterium]